MLSPGSRFDPDLYPKGSATPTFPAFSMPLIPAAVSHQARGGHISALFRALLSLQPDFGYLYPVLDPTASILEVLGWGWSSPAALQQPCSSLAAALQQPCSIPASGSLENPRETRGKRGTGSAMSSARWHRAPLPPGRALEATLGFSGPPKRKGSSL